VAQAHVVMCGVITDWNEHLGFVVRMVQLRIGATRTPEFTTCESRPTLTLVDGKDKK
jgi:hypothetical protein